MEKFKFLEHTADQKFQAYGKNLEEAFANAMLAVTKTMTDDTVKPKLTRKIEVEANKKEALLYEWLEQAIYLVDTEGFLISEISAIMIEELDGDYRLKAVVKGDFANNYEIKTHIKAMTYSEMHIKERKDNVEIQAVLDI